MATPFNPKITAAGLALFPNPAIAGFSVSLTHIALGTSLYTPTGTETALKAEVARFPITGGGVASTVPNQAQIGAIITAMDPQGRSPNEKFIGEIGIYAGSTLFAVWSRTTTPLFFKSTDFDVPLAYRMDISRLPAGSVTVAVDVNTVGMQSIINGHELRANPHPQYATHLDVTAQIGTHTRASDPHPGYLTQARGDARYLAVATTEAKGVVELATNVEAAEGLDSSRAVTPTGLRAGLASHENKLDPHPQYTTHAEAAALDNAAVAAHENKLDPHPQYTTHAEAAALDNAAVAAHENKLDPHPQYTTHAEATALDNAAVSTHEGKADPHAQYLTTARGDVRYLVVATSDVKGIVELATAAEVSAGTDTTRAVTPAGLGGKMQWHLDTVDPHPQYTTPAEATALDNAAIVVHKAESDPHPQYMTQAESDARYAALGALRTADVLMALRGARARRFYNSSGI